MDKNDLDFFEDLIQKKLYKANEEIDRIKSEIENAEGEEEYNYTNLLNHQVKYVNSLQQALVRIKNGTFGICDKTGEEISLERLKSVPNSNMSVFAKNVQNNDKNSNKKKIKE